MTKTRQRKVLGVRGISRWASTALRESSLLIAVAASVGVVGWQSAYIEFAHAGNWTALFLTGEAFGVPPALDNESVYQVPGGTGYDGQFYHVIAHDLKLQPESREHLDSPRLRWRRILVPALASALALGQDKWIDRAYIAVVLSAVFLGVFWLARYARLHDLPAYFGFMFLAVPAVLVGIERMTVDVVLAALAVGFWYYDAKGPRWAVSIILVLAPLVRETGIALPIAAAGYALYRRDWCRAATAAAAALPFLGWVVYVHSSTAADIQDQWTTFIPFWGILSRTNRLFFGYPPRGDVFHGVFLDGLAVLGMWAALLLAYRVLRDKPLTLPKASIAVFALFTVFLGSRSVWYEGIAFARVLSPFIIWVAMYGISNRSWQMAIPLALTFPREADELLHRSIDTVNALRSWL